MTVKEKANLKRALKSRFMEVCDAKSSSIDLTSVNVKLDDGKWYRRRQRLAFKYINEEGLEVVFTKKMKAISEVGNSLINGLDKAEVYYRPETVTRAITAKKTDFKPESDWQFLICLEK